jgi:acetyl-CoA acetyltransferase
VIVFVGDIKRRVSNGGAHMVRTGREHMAKYGTKPEHFAMIGEKNHRHSSGNPYAQFRTVYSLEEIASSRMTYAPLTKQQCSPTSDGAGAAIVCSEQFVLDHGLGGTPPSHVYPLTLLSAHPHSPSAHTRVASRCTHVAYILPSFRSTQWMAVS